MTHITVKDKELKILEENIEKDFHGLVAGKSFQSRTRSTILSLKTIH